MKRPVSPRGGRPLLCGRDFRDPVPMRIRDRIAERTAFSALHVPRSRKPCDLWLGNLSGGCRPQIGWFDGHSGVDVVAPVSNLLYRLHRCEGRPFMPGSIICHTCDVATCVNPEHLYLGTPETNAFDLSRRGSSLDNGLAAAEARVQLFLRREAGARIPAALVRRARRLGVENIGGPVGFERPRWGYLDRPRGGELR